MTSISRFYEQVSRDYSFEPLAPGSSVAFQVKPHLGFTPDIECSAFHRHEAEPEEVLGFIPPEAFYLSASPGFSIDQPGTSFIDINLVHTNGMAKQALRLKVWVLIDGVKKWGFGLLIPKGRFRADASLVFDIAAAP